MLRAILNKSWWQHTTRHQLYGHLPPITKTIQVRRTRHAGHCWRSRDELIRDVLLWTPTHGRAKAGRPARTYIQQLCEDTGCCPEDLPRAMNNREEWRERVRDIRATSTTWWWWWLIPEKTRRWRASSYRNIRRILEGVRAKNLQATLIFVDFTKAFDSIHRGKMEQILLAYGIPKETVAAITILYRNTEVKVRSPDGDTEYFDIVAGVLQGDTLAPYLFIICLDYVLRTSIDKIKENGFELTKKRSRRYPATTITDADYADDIAILANTPDQAETLLHSLERAAASIGLHVNAHKTEYMCYNQTGDISTLEGTPLKLVDKFTYLGSSVESTEKDIDTRLTKAWTAINRLSTIWKSDLTDKMKRSFFQAAVTSILLYGCTTWTLTKRLEKKLDGNYTRMLRAILNKSWQQHPTRHQLYGHLPPITKTIQVRRTRHAGHCWRSRDELIRDVLLWIPTHGRAKAGRPARTYIQQLCEDTGCCPEDLPRAMNDREEWRKRVRDIRAASTIWWWWWLERCRLEFALDHLTCYRNNGSQYYRWTISLFCIH